MIGDGIDLWQFPLDGGPKAANAALAFLNPDERARSRQFGSPQLAAAFAIRRAARRIILARYLGVAPSDVRICETASGKPELGGPSPGWHFSASHSKFHGLVAVTSRFPVGVDIELQRRIDATPLAERILSPSERLEFGDLEPDARDAGMFRVWTGKEALVKGIGLGLELRDMPLISLPIAPAPGVWRPAELGARMKAHGAWYVCSLAPSKGYFTSLAAPAEAKITARDARGLLAEQGL